MLAKHSTEGTRYRDFWVNSNGIELHALDWGGSSSDRCVIMLHGIGQTAMTFNTLGPRLRDILGDRYRFVSYDDRGAGDSMGPIDGYSIEDIAADLDAIVASLGAKDVVVIGHSRGGWYSAAYAALRPKLVSKIVLIDPARLMYANAGESAAVYAQRKAALGPFPSMSAALESERLRAPASLWTSQRAEACADRYRERYDGSVVGKMTLHVLDRLTSVRNADPLSPVAKNAAADALMFVSQRSDPARIAQKMVYQKILPRIDVTMLDGGHYLQYDCEREVVTGISEFLA